MSVPLVEMRGIRKQFGAVKANDSDSGEILIDGVAAAIMSPRDAVHRGIGMVFQQFSLVPALSVLESFCRHCQKRHGFSAAKARACERRCAGSNGLRPALILSVRYAR